MLPFPRRLSASVALFFLGCAGPSIPPNSAEAPPKAEPKAASTCKSDCLGPLFLGLEASEVERLFGVPEPREEGVLEEATGLVVSRLAYPSRGLEIFVAPEEEGSPSRVIRFLAKKPSSLATNRGVKIGSSRADVRRLYSERLSNEGPYSESEIVDSIYGGIVLSFESERVSEIFFGAAAE